MNFFRGKKKNGFFIEAGAYDGEMISNTLYFELRHQVQTRVELIPGFKFTGKW
jgi:hypothetical protein